MCSQALGPSLPVCSGKGDAAGQGPWLGLEKPLPPLRTLAFSPGFGELASLSALPGCPCCSGFVGATATACMLWSLVKTVCRSRRGLFVREALSPRPARFFPALSQRPCVLHSVSALASMQQVQAAPCMGGIWSRRAARLAGPLWKTPDSQAEAQPPAFPLLCCFPGPLALFPHCSQVRGTSWGLRPGWPALSPVPGTSLRLALFPTSLPTPRVGWAT